MKKCSICQQFKKLSEFNKDKGQKDGLSYTCGLCVKNYRNTHKKQIRASRKKYYHKHKEESQRYQKEHREELTIYHQKWKKLNRDSVIIKARKYRQIHKKHRNKQIRERQLNDIEFKILRDLRTRIVKAIKIIQSQNSL